MSERAAGGPTVEDLRLSLRSPDRTNKHLAIKSAIAATPRVPAADEPDPRLAVVKEALAAERDQQVVSALMRALAHWGGNGAASALKPFLEHAEGRVVSNALEGLAASGDPAVAPLVVPLLGHANPRVRATAAAVLCKLDHDQTLEAAAKFLVTATSQPAQMAAVHALRAVGSVPAETLQRLIEKTPDPLVAAELRELLAATMSDGFQKALQLTRVRITRTFSRVQLDPLLNPGAGAAARGRSLLRVGAAVLSVGAAALLWLSFGGAELPVALPGLAGARVRPAAIARAPVEKYRGSRVSWRGTVVELRGPDVLVSVAGGGVHVVRGADAHGLSVGDSVELTGSVQGRSATGLVYLDAALKVLQSRPASPRAGGTGGGIL